MPDRKWLWFGGIKGTMTVTCSVCGCVVDISLRTQHEDFHRNLQKGDGNDHPETTTIHNATSSETQGVR